MKIDAEKTVPFETILKYRHKATNSFALASDYFRFKLQQENAGIWCDCDMVALEKIALPERVLIGRESNKFLNGAILYIQKDETILADALALFSDNNVPAGLPLRKTSRFYLMKILGSHFGPADLPRGAFGPKALTALVEGHGLQNLAAPRQVYYPIPPREAGVIFKPDMSLERYLCKDTVAVHLWNEKLGSQKHQKPIASSILGKLLIKHGF
ncbi:hypothetical protein WNY59_11890 [Ahrensia kielensis]|uniref:Alpha 1,4-glycosyltransferase domain-containing protein n=1 Tax=Ahrensia kielensis TaxID=76980 RepID=A0ABU9T827_9HYPH